MNQRFGAIAVVSLLLAALPSLAQADIGRVGGTGPVTVMNRQRQPSYHPPAPPSNPALLVIRYNRHHIYYDRALMEAVESARQVKPGASYRLVNTVPVGNSPSQTDRISKNAEANLQAVMLQMQADGIAPAQIDVETHTGQPGGIQEIQVFVR